VGNGSTTVTEALLISVVTSVVDVVVVVGVGTGSGWRAGAAFALLLFDFWGLNTFLMFDRNVPFG
jgi:hypothetical protein